MTRKQMILARWQIFTIGGRRMRIRGGAPFKAVQAKMFKPGAMEVTFAVVDSDMFDNLYAEGPPTDRTVRFKTREAAQAATDMVNAWVTGEADAEVF